MLLTVGIHLGEEQGLLLSTEPVLEVLLIAVAVPQVHVKPVANTTMIQLMAKQMYSREERKSTIQTEPAVGEEKYFGREQELI